MSSRKALRLTRRAGSAGGRPRWNPAVRRARAPAPRARATCSRSLTSPPGAPCSTAAQSSLAYACTQVWVIGCFPRLEPSREALAAREGRGERGRRRPRGLRARRGAAARRTRARRSGGAARPGSAAAAALSGGAQARGGPSGTERRRGAAARPGGAAATGLSGGAAAREQERAGAVRGLRRGLRRRRRRSSPAASRGVGGSGAATQRCRASKRGPRGAERYWPSHGRTDGRAGAGQHRGPAAPSRVRERAAALPAAAARCCARERPSRSRRSG
jgi:hypothetical protein